MVFPFKFNVILLKKNIGRSISLLFLNRQKNDAIVFNGFEFNYFSDSNVRLDEFVLLEYNKRIEDQDCFIENITSDYDIYFIKFSNGDIMQISYLMDSITSQQQVLIYAFNAPNYHLALQSYISEASITLKENQNINLKEWLSM